MYKGMKKDCLLIVAWLLGALVYLLNAGCMFDTLFEVQGYNFPVVGAALTHTLLGLGIERKVSQKTTTKQQDYSV